MKKLLALLNTPARAVIAVGLIVLVSEYLIMALFDAIVIQGAFPFMDDYQLVMIFNYLDPILLIAIVAPILYILIFRPMRNQQDELEVARRKVERAHREWMAALDVVDDPIFLHDKAFRILRCNKAYQQHAGIPFPEIIGQPYYEILPKTGAPLPCCLRALGKEEEAAEELAVGEASYRSRAFSIKNEQGVYLYSMHILEDITERKRSEEKLHESEKLYRTLFENMLNGFAYCRMIFEQDQPQDFIYLSVNAAFETLTGLKNIAGRRVSEVIPGIRQSDPGLFEIYGRVSLSGKPEQFEIYVEALQQWFWISVYSPEKGYFVAVFDVITERKLAEAKLAEQLDELRGWHDITLGREMRVLDLKHEVDELLGQAGQPPRYPSAESDDLLEK